MENARNDVAGDVLPHRRVAEKRRHVDQNGVEQLREFVGVRFEVVRIARIAVDARVLHPLPDAAIECRSFVGAEVEPPALLEVLEQLLEAVSGNVCSLMGFSAPARRQRPAIWLSGSTKSTNPMRIAAAGMPKNSDVP